MNIEFRDGLLFTSIQITYRGNSKTINNIVIDTGAAETIISTDAVDDIGVYAESGDKIITFYGVGGIILGNIILPIIIIIIGFFSYTILEFLLDKKRWIKESKRLWNSPWIFLWGSILLALSFFVVPGNYKPWGNILYIKEAFKHIFMWELGILIYYFFTDWNLTRSAAAWNWEMPEFYYFCFVVPVFEEVLFRGIILINLLNMFPILTYEEPLVMVSSLLFALFHFNYDQNFQFNKRYLFGLILIFIWGNAIGYLILLTGSLWMSICMHILFNITGAICFNIKRIKT